MAKADKKPADEKPEEKKPVSLVKIVNGVPWSGHNFSYAPGEIVKVPEDVANARVKAGLAAWPDSVDADALRQALVDREAFESPAIAALKAEIEALRASHDEHAKAHAELAQAHAALKAEFEEVKKSLAEKA